MLDNMKILRDLVVVQAITQKKKAHAGFALPDELSDAGKVIAVGPEAKDIPIGSIIYFGNESKSMTIKGNAYTVMELNNVVGVESEEDGKEILGEN